MEPEYCLTFVSWLPPAWSELTCLSKGAWAAWAQALLSVAAVVYSVRVSRQQHELDGKRQRNASRQEVVDQLNSYLSLADDQYRDLMRCKATVDAQLEFETDLHKAVCYRARVLANYTTFKNDPLDAQWLVLLANAELDTAFDAYQQIFWQRTDPSVARSDQAVLSARLDVGMVEAPKKLNDVREWIAVRQRAME